MGEKRRVAIMLELSNSLGRHVKIFNGTQKYARERGWDCFIDEYAGHTLPERKTGLPPYDGIIARATTLLYERARILKIPVVNVWFNSPVRDKLPLIQNDWDLSGRLSAAHFLERGFTRFGALFFGNALAQKIEIDAFKNVVTGAGYDCDLCAVKSTYHDNPRNWMQTIPKIDEWFLRLRPPVGLLISSDSLAQYIIQRARKQNWNVPRDVAVITSYEEQILAEYPPPKLTSIDNGYQSVGYEAARLLDAMMDGLAPPSEPVVVPPGGILPRESTDFFAVEDDMVARALRYISEHLQEQIGPEDIASALSVTPVSLYRRFKEHLGHPIAAEIRRLRLALAKRLLVEPDRTVTEVAEDAGFGDPQTMLQVFKREIGISPREYRKKNLSSR